VETFLSRGEKGGGRLPRDAAGKRNVEREKAKRQKGQSTHSHWKSEAEMVLRQQFDS